MCFEYFYVLSIKTSVLALLLAGMMSISIPNPVYAQMTDDLEIYGYFQNRFVARTTTSNPDLGPENSTSFLMQQLNMFFRKQFDPQFSAFVNIETTQSYSSENNWGSIRIEEAWMRYRHSKQLNIKAGLLIPTFNYLNKIKNRTPLLPYVLRPLVYETTTDNFISTREFVPRQGFLEVYGTLSLSKDWEAQYALFTGNQEGFVADTEISTLSSGEDTSNGFIFGGRIGLKYKAWDLGLSATFDESNQKTLKFAQIEFPGVGILDRYRIGMDLSRSYKALFFNAELTRVTYKATPSTEQTLEEIGSVNPFIGDSNNKFFYYVTLGYYFNDKMFAYGMYSYLEEDILITLEDGVRLYSLGVGYNPIPQVSFKVQALDAYTPRDAFFFIELKGILIGCSIFI